MSEQCVVEEGAKASGEGEAERCPWCGGGVEFDGIIFFEEGGFTSAGRYENEGEIETLRCKSEGCRRRFAVVPALDEPTCGDGLCAHVESVHGDGGCMVDDCGCKKFVGNSVENAASSGACVRDRGDDQEGDGGQNPRVR